MAFGRYGSKPGTAAISTPPVISDIATGWETITDEFTRRTALVEVYGDTGTGRTAWALSAPGPIALIHCSEKIDGLVQRVAANGKVIRAHNFGSTVFRGSPEVIAKQADGVWRLMQERFHEAFSWARTIVVDTHTDAWELIRLARFGSLKPSGGRIDANYGPVNAEFKTMLSAFRGQTETNVIFIGKTTDEYVKSKSAAMGERTGRTISSGMKQVPFIVDVRVRTHHTFEDEDFRSVIEKGWFNAHSEGSELTNEDSTFPMVMGLVTGTDPDEWDVPRATPKSVGGKAKVGLR